MDAIRKGRIQTRWLLHSYAEDGHNITWMDKMTNEDLYGNLPRISNKIRERRLRLPRHCVRHSELEVSNLVLWKPTQGKFNKGSQRLTYVDRVRKHTGLQTTAELRTLMKNKCEWRAIARGDSTWWWWWWYIHYIYIYIYIYIHVHTYIHTYMVTIDHPYEMAHRESSGHLPNDFVLPQMVKVVTSLSLRRWIPMTVLDRCMITVAHLQKMLQHLWKNVWRHLHDVTASWLSSAWI